MFEIECVLDEGSWEFYGCQISTIICLLGFKQIRLWVPKVLGPQYVGSVDFSEGVTLLMRIHFNQKKIHSPSGLVYSFKVCFSSVLVSGFLSFNLRQDQLKNNLQSFKCVRDIVKHATCTNILRGIYYNQTEW